MAYPIAKWIQERFSVLWEKFSSSNLTFEMIEEALPDDNRNTISVMIGDLRKAGWIEIQRSSEDARKRIYNLKEPNEILRELKNG